MRNPLCTPFAAVFRNEVLLNSRRLAPYALMILFGANAVLWWGWGPAVRLGWATNSEFYIVRSLQGFSFILGLPIFNAIIMGDAVIRDFRLGIDPLIFSKPVPRTQYLLGKFLGNFFVLFCCQSAFVLTLVVLQAFRTSQMVVLPMRVFPYFRHFVFFVVISHLVLAACYFTVGTLTRNPKFVYGLAACFYPLYISYQVFLLKSLPPRWGALLDPFLLNTGVGPAGGGFGYSADFLNRFVVSYSADMIANRVLVILATAVLLAILYFRFTIAERATEQGSFSVLDLSTATQRIHYDPETFAAAQGQRADISNAVVKARPQSLALPQVTRINRGVRANLKKLLAATGLELQLLLAEKSLLVLVPLAVLLSFLALPFSAGGSELSHAAAFAGSTARGTLMFLLGVIVFYTGEAMHRDREIRVEPVLWTAPAPNFVFLISKFLATLLLALALLCAIGLTAMLTQSLRGQMPIEVSAYLLTYSVILVPSLAFMGATCIALNVLLRDKYLAYALIIAISSGLFYLYTQGYNHWLYNPVLYGLWTDADLISGAARIPLLRIYCLGITLLSLCLAHLCFERKSVRSNRGKR